MLLLHDAAETVTQITWKRHGQAKQTMEEGGCILFPFKCFVVMVHRSNRLIKDIKNNRVFLVCVRLLREWSLPGLLLFVSPGC